MPNLLRLLNTDCREAMAALAEIGAQFNALITDPPYEIDMHRAKSGDRSIRKDGYASPKKLDFDAIDPERAGIVDAAKALCNGWMLIFCTPEGVAAWRDAIEASGARYKRACVWVKPDAAPQFNGQGPAMGAEMLVTAWGGKGHSRWNGGGRRGVFTHNTNPPNRDGRHPTEKPLSLMMELVELFTNPGDTVFDPFMGSGTTGVACMMLGRGFVGIERDADYFAVAEERIRNACNSPTMFFPTPQLDQGADPDVGFLPPRTKKGVKTMTGLLKKIEDFAAEIGADVEEVFDEFVAFVRGKKAEAEKNGQDAPSADQNSASNTTEAGTANESAGAADAAAGGEPQPGEPAAASTEAAQGSAEAGSQADAEKKE